MAIDYEHYLKFSYWTGLECVALLNGYTPDEYDGVVMAERRYREEFIERNSPHNRYIEKTEFDKEYYLEQSKLSRDRRKWLKKTIAEAKKISSILVRDIELSVITPDSIDGETVFFSPENIINWAIAKGFDVPNELKSHAEQAKPQAETVAKNGRGSKTGKKESQLHILIWRVHQFLLDEKNKKVKAQEVWLEIQHRHETHDTAKIIQEVNSNEILWCSCYNNEQKLQRSSFDKTLSTIKKKSPPF